MPSPAVADDFAPPEGAHASRFTVVQADIDEFGHANNVVWVRWVNEAAIRHSLAVGLGADEYRRLGLLWVVRRHDVEYLVPALLGEVLEAVTWVTPPRGATTLRRTLFRRAMDGKLLARAATTWAMVDAAGRPRRIPLEVSSRYGFAE